jgi:hypothetical protein
VQRHGRSPTLLLEVQDAVILTVLLHLASTFFPLRQTREAEFLFFGFLKSECVRRAAFLSEDALCHQFLKALLLLMSGSERVLCGRPTR